jgi:hypothetical protein
MPTLSQSRDSTSFEGRNFMFVPVEPASITPPRHISAIGGGLIILSGVAIIDFGENNNNIREDTFTLEIDQDFTNAINLAPPRPGLIVTGFVVAKAVPFATVNESRWQTLTLHLEGGQTIPGHLSGTGVIAFSPGGPGPVLQFTARVVNHSSATTIHRVGYHLSLYGTLLGRPRVDETVGSGRRRRAPAARGRRQA